MSHHYWHRGIAGGWDGNDVSSAELYDPGLGTWSSTGSLQTARYFYLGNHRAVTLPNGKVLIAGGYGGGAWLSSAELYDPITGAWYVTGSLAAASLSFRVIAPKYEYEGTSRADWRGFQSARTEQENVYTNSPKTGPD